MVHATRQIDTATLPGEWQLRPRALILEHAAYPAPLTAGTLTLLLAVESCQLLDHLLWALASSNHQALARACGVITGAHQRSGPRCWLKHDGDELVERSLTICGEIGMIQIPYDGRSFDPRTFECGGAWRAAPELALVVAAPPRMTAFERCVNRALADAAGPDEVIPDIESLIAARRAADESRHE